MTVYKADLKTNLYCVIGFTILICVTIFLSPRFPTNSWLFLVALFLLFVLYNLFITRLNQIHVDKTNKLLILIYKNSFVTIKTKKYDLASIKFSYKRQATSFRGGIKNVCSLYDSDNKIEQLVPDNDGWDDSEIFSFVLELINEGIEKKFIGYSLKDVEI